MKRAIYCISFFSLVMIYAEPQESSSNVVVHIQDQQQDKMKLLIGLIDPCESSTEQFVSVLNNNLSCKNQKLSGFNVSIKKFATIPTKKMIKQLAGEGFFLALFMQQKSKNKIEWRLYDTTQAKMQQGKRISFAKQSIESTGNALSDELWTLLTGQQGIFSLRLAYCVEKQDGIHKGTDIYVQSPYSDSSSCIVKGGRLLAPRWNNDIKNPILLYSEITPTNVRLMATTLDNKKHVVANFEGLTMLPSFSSDGQKVVYCATNNGTSQLFYCYIDAKRKRIVSKQVTNNGGNNTSPTLRDNGDIIFCSDFELKTPQLYYYHSANGVVERLTDSGYCACPHFCEKNQKIAFCKFIGSTTQVFEYDLATKQQKQVTVNVGNKDECCWSYDGNYIAYSVEAKGAKRIALFNCITREEYYITGENKRCSYPTWGLPG